MCSKIILTSGKHRVLPRDGNVVQLFRRLDEPSVGRVSAIARLVIIIFIRLQNSFVVRRSLVIVCRDDFRNAGKTYPSVLKRGMLFSAAAITYLKRYFIQQHP